MADDNFRSNSGRNSWARGEGARDGARRGANDPLAELARLIGQGDPYAERGARRSADEAAPGFDWAANEDYAEEAGHAEEHPAPPPLPPASYSTYAADEQDYADEPPSGGRYFSGSAGKSNGFGVDPGAYASDDQAPVSSSRQLPAFMSAAPVGPYEAEEPDRAQEAGEDYGDYAEEYYDEPHPRRRGGLIVMIAVLGLVVVGTAGALAYRNMFGGAVFAGLPPIIKASIAPNKILPNNGDAQADNSAQSGAAQANSDKLVSREEQPVNMEAPKVGSRVVATIPIGAGQMPPPLVTAAPAPAAADGAAPSYGTASAGTASVPQPDAGQPAPLPTSTATVSTPAALAPVPAAPSEPKKVRTVLIHADQSGATAAQPAVPLPAPAPASRSARSAAAKASASPAAAAAPAAANAPLSIVSGAEGEAAPTAAVASAPPAPVAAAPSRPRAAAAAPAPVALASADTGAAAAPASAPSGSGYAVQVTSQHSEADAKASFKELKAKFPTQLGGREPIIRRADLGAKGVFYRAMVGPFASMEEAAGICSSLKAAGGNCLVQRN